MKKDYQQLTNKIAKEAGLQIDDKQFSDPIYQSWMEGNFLRSLLHARHPWIKLLLSITFFFIPVCIWLISITSQESPDILNQVFISILAVFFTLIGLKIFISGLADFSIHKK